MYRLVKMCIMLLVLVLCVLCVPAYAALHTDNENANTDKRGNPYSEAIWSEEYNLGYSAGHDSGYSVGFTDGYNSGHKKGFADGDTSGYLRMKDEQKRLIPLLCVAIAIPFSLLAVALLSLSRRNQEIKTLRHVNLLQSKKIADLSELLNKR